MDTQQGTVQLKSPQVGRQAFRKLEFRKQLTIWGDERMVRSSVRMSEQLVSWYVRPNVRVVHGGS